MPIFVMHEHHASHHHFDFRLQMGGVLASWAVPKGPPELKGERRLAIHVPDHELGYAAFEGVIPEGEYGAGTVHIWDRGTFQLKEGSVDAGKLDFILNGQRMTGPYALVKMKPSAGRPVKDSEWLLIRR